MKHLKIIAFVVAGLIVGLCAAISSSGELKNNSIMPDGSYALGVPGYVNVRSLAAKVAETVSVPTNATHVYFASTANFYIDYALTNEANIVTNGTFAANESWTLGAGWDIANGNASATAATSSIQQDISTATDALGNSLNSLDPGRSYSVTFTTESVTGGSVTPWLGGTLGTARSGNDTYTETIVAGSDNDSIGFVGAALTGNIDTVVITPIAVIPGDIDNGGGLELNPTVRRVTNVSALSVISPSAAVVTCHFTRR